MMQISSTFSAPPLLSPRTTKYVSALMREGDNFDYSGWLQGVREEEAQAKQAPATLTSGDTKSVEIDPPIRAPDCRSAWPTRPGTDDRRRAAAKSDMATISRTCAQDCKGSI